SVLTRQLPLQHSPPATPPTVTKIPPNSMSNGAGGSNPPAPPPPSNAPVTSKRDKRRNLLADRLTEMQTGFERDRDVYYRAQLAALQSDFNAIARADISGKDLRMLEDDPDAIERIVSG